RRRGRFHDIGRSWDSGGGPELRSIVNGEGNDSPAASRIRPPLVLRRRRRRPRRVEARQGDVHAGEPSRHAQIYELRRHVVVEVTVLVAVDSGEAAPELGG